MNIGNNFNLRFSYTFSEWVKATIFYNSRKLSGGDLFLLPLLGLSLYEFWLNFSLRQIGLDYSFWGGIFWLLVLIVVKLELVYLLFLWLKDLRRKKDSKIVYEFTFNDEAAGYSYTDKTGSANITQSWSQFKKLKESSEAFFIVYKTDGHWVIPKHYFVNEDEINSFRYFVKNKIGEQKREK